MKTFTRPALLALVLGSFAACSGSGSNPVAPIARATASSAPVTSTASGAAVPYGKSLLSGATYLGHASLAELGLDVFVPMRDQAGLIAYSKEASDPKSGFYRHWLTPQELGDRFGASQADYNAAVNAFTAAGIAVKAYPQRQMIRVRGAQAPLERMLGTTFGFYQKGKTTFVAPATDPRPAASLHVAALGGAVTYTRRQRNLVPIHIGMPFIQGYAPQQVANAFDFTGAYNAGYKGGGITIGIIGTGPITDGDPRIGIGDVAELRKLYGVTGTGSVVQIYDTSNVSPGTGQNGTSYSSGLATPPPVTSMTAPGCTSGGNLYVPGDPADSTIVNYNTCNPEDIEAQLDTEQAATLAPNATINFYIAYNPMECFGTCGASGSEQAAPELGLFESDDEIQQAIADNKSDIISMSFGSDEADNAGLYFGTGSNNFGVTELASLLAQGTAIFVSSGDAGAEECDGSPNTALNPDNPCVAYPATDPSVVSVGGVNAPISDGGALTGPVTAWGVQTQISGLTPGGTGGGCSVFFQAPTYETSVAQTFCPNGSAGLRTQPDVSLVADTNTGVAVVVDADPSLAPREIAEVGGTSVSAPEMAAMWALVLSACKQTANCNNAGSGATPWRLGNPNPLLFPILNNHPTMYANTFYDVQYGNNALPNSSGDGSLDPGFLAGVGYDLTTGMGVPYARNLIKYVVGV